MPKLNKSASGLLLYENFETSSTIWTPSPNNYNELEFGSNGLRMKHSSTYKTYTIQEPQANYCFTCKLNHIPLNEQDIGGVIVMSNDTSFLECQSYVASKHSYVTNSDEDKQVIIDFIDEILDGYVTYKIQDDDSEYPDDPDELVKKYNYTSTNSTFEDVMYQYIKVVKKYEIYSFFASTDGKQWIEVGNSKFPDSHRLGFFLRAICFEGQEDTIDMTSSNFYIDYAMFYSSNYVIINGIKNEYVLELRDKEGNLITDSTKPDIDKRGSNFYIDTTLLEVPKKTRFVLIDDKGTIRLDYTADELIGGDEYDYTYNISLYADGIKVNQEELFELSAFNSKDQTVRIDIQNNEEFIIENLSVSISAYSVYYSGYETLGVSLYDDDKYKWDFKESVTIKEILPTESQSVLLKLTSRIIQDYYRKDGAFRFKLNIE